MAEFTPTPEQRAAITSIDESVCVRAGAGTGKTAVLVGRYLELLRRKSVPVTCITAMTYTEKAAREMKDRIRRECAAQERRETNPERKAWWRRQRIDLETADISTIHGFCAGILREHPVEAGIDPHFAVLDEVELGLLTEQCVADAIEARLDAEDEPALELLKEFGRDGVHDILKGLMLNRAAAEEALSQIESNTDEEFLSRVRTLLSGEQAESLRRMLDVIEREGLLVRIAGAESSDPTDKLEVRRSRTLHILRELVATDDPQQRMERVRELPDALMRASASGSRKNWPANDLLAVRGAMKRVKEIFDGDVRGLLGLEVGVEDMKSLAFARVLASLYRDVATLYVGRKAAEGFLDFDDLLLRARRLLDEREDVRKKVRNRIRYLLVDELQDSALIERDMVLMMVRDESAFKRTGEVRIVPGRLFVVGDDKQSIYRFRGAEVTVFRELAERLESDGSVIDLTTNFRTVPAGVAFANDLFARLMPRGIRGRPYESEYFELEANRDGEDPFLEVMIPEPVADETIDEARRREALMIAERIRGMVEVEKVRVFDTETRTWRGAQYRDVAILFRAMTDSHVYERRLREAGIPYYVISGRGFYGAQEIRDVLHLLKVLEHPRDQVALTGVLRSPMFGINDETLFFMRRKGSVRQGLASAEWVENINEEQRRGLSDAAATLEELARIKNRVPLSRLLREALSRTAFDATLLAQFAGRQRLANVEKLIDLAEAFERKGVFSLDEFIRHVEEFVETESRESERPSEEESSNIVTLMSVHRAKGLEFPIVFVADASRSTRAGRTGRLLLDRGLGVTINPKTDDLGHDGNPVLFDLLKRENRRREEAENLRLLYVALTRARDRLVVSGGVTRYFSRDSWLCHLTREYELLDDKRNVIREEFVYGEDGHRAAVRTDVPEPTPREERRRERRGWRAVRRLRRLVNRLDDVERAREFEFARYVSPVALDLGFKRRFVASEFVQYSYCPRMYRLAWIDGIEGDGGGPAADEGRPDGRLVGTLVHRVLAAWDLADRDTLEETVDRAMTGMSFPSPETSSSVRDEVLHIIAGAHEAGLFGGIAGADEHRREYHVAARVDDFVVEGVIDGLHRLEDGTWELVDYKTDHVGSTPVEELAAHHELQLAGYALALERLGIEVSRVSLLFLRPGRTCVWACDAKQREAWTARLRRIVGDVRAGRFEKRETDDCRCSYSWTCRVTAARSNPEGS